MNKSRNNINNDNNDNNKIYKSVNIPLLLFDIILLPIHIFRMILIYFGGSKYNLKGFQFLDVIMHADKPYFNQDDCKAINTIGKDYRIVMRDDSRLFPIDILDYLKINKIYENKNKNDEDNNNDNNIIIGSTVHNKNELWDISTEDFQGDNKKIRIKNRVDNDLSSDTDSVISTDSENKTEFNDITDNDNILNSVTNDSTYENKDIKGVNYFDDNDDNREYFIKSKNIKSNKKDLLQSLREDLDSVFEYLDSN